MGSMKDYLMYLAYSLLDPFARDDMTQAEFDMLREFAKELSGDDNATHWTQEKLIEFFQSYVQYPKKEDETNDTISN